MDTTIKQTTWVCSAWNKKDEIKEEDGDLDYVQEGIHCNTLFKKTNTIPIDHKQVGEKKCQQEYETIAFPFDCPLDIFSFILSLCHSEFTFEKANTISW